MTFFSYLVSAKLEGRSTVIAPPKREVFVKAILSRAIFDVEILTTKVCVVIDCACCWRSYMFALCRFGDGRVW
jgi:hypothetical protein